MGSRNAEIAEELEAALKGVRWNYNRTSRNPHHHEGARKSRERLSMAVRAAINALRSSEPKKTFESVKKVVREPECSKCGRVYCDCESKY